MPSRKTLAMVQTAPRKLEPRELPLPEIDADTALLRVEACGICGSDHEQFEGVLRTPLPVIPGHEPLGTIEAIGDRAARRWGVNTGDRVAVETMLSCRFCGPCLAGSYHLCRQRRIYSYIPLAQPPGLWGAYAQHMFLDATSIVHRIDPALPAATAVMFNPLGAGFRWAVEIPRTGPGDTVVILGPGQRGLACVLACREAGAAKIIVTGLAADAKKLALAAAFGAHHTVDVENENAKQRIQELTGGEGARVVVDVSSYSTAPVAEALDYVAPGGMIVLAGVKGWKPIPEFISDKIVLKEIELRGAIGVTSSGYRRAIELLEARRTPIERMHTHDFALRDAELAIRTLARQVPGRRVDPLLSAAVGARVTSEPVRRWVEESPYGAALGVRVHELASERVVIELPYADRNSNPGKVLHGGVAASLAAIGGQAVTRLALGEDAGPWHTAALQVSYLAAAIDEDVRATATLLREGKQLCFVAVDVSTVKGKPIAYASNVVRARLGAAPAALQRTAGDAGASDPGPMGPAIGQLPFMAALGIRVEHMTGGTSRLVMPWLDANADAAGGVHEGALLALLDTTGAMAAWAETGPGRFKASTPALQAQLLGPAPKTDLVAYGRMCQRDDELLWSDAEIASAVDGRVFARGTVVYRIVA